MRYKGAKISINTVKIQLLKAEPELFGSDGENLLKSEMTRSVVLRTFVLTVLRVLNSERLDREEMIDLLYGYSEEDPKNPNNIDQSLSKVFNPLRNKEEELQGKTPEKIIKGVWVDICELKELTEAFSQTPPQDVLEIEQNALQIVSLYGRGLLPSWKDAWLTAYRTDLEAQYCTFLRTLAHLLLEARQTTILERIVHCARKYHTDPNREEKKTLDKIIEQINTQSPKQEEKPIPEPAKEETPQPQQGGKYTQIIKGKKNTAIQGDNLTVNIHPQKESA